MSQETQLRPALLASAPQWSVYRCASGCVHLRNGNVSFSFSASEFCRFVQLLGDAYVRFSVHETVANARELH
ncbi:MAG: hypothetical protein AB7F99_00570 [Vicinamibacterales bacterium]